MCKVCLPGPNCGGCPHEPEPEPVYVCLECGEGIYPGDKYYRPYSGGYVCLHCLEDKSVEELLALAREALEVANV